MVDEPSDACSRTDGDGVRVGRNNKRKSSRACSYPNKRGGSTTYTTSSPNKKSKSPMVKCINNLIRTIKVVSSKEVLVVKEIQQETRKVKVEQKMQEEERKWVETAKSMDVVRGLGLTEDTEEFYVAGMLFEHEYHRNFFNSLTTDTGRVAWLKRWVRYWNV